MARLHATEIDEGFLSTLGPGFLGRLYRRIISHPASFVLVASPADTVHGFVAGSADVTGLYRDFLLRDGPAAAVSTIPRLLASWRRVWETLRHGGAGRSDPGGAELLSIAVDAPAQGRGLGRHLVEAFLEELDGRGVCTARVVVAVDNRRAIRLYGGCGFVPKHEFELHAGARSLLMQRNGRGEPRAMKTGRASPDGMEGGA